MRHVIITGGSSGIGEAFARHYLGGGDRISLVARDRARLEQARERLLAGRPEGQVAVFSADVRDAERLGDAIARAEAEFGPCDLLIASAGIARPGRFEEIELSQFGEQMAVNYFGSVHAARAVYPGMMARRHGTILFVSSAVGLFGFYGYTAYGPSKFAVTGFAGSLRAEARRHGVRVAICFPADTDTPQLRAEQALMPVETKAITRMAGLMSADRLAGIVARRLEAGRFAIYPSLLVMLLARGAPLVQPAVNMWLDWKVNRVSPRRNRAGS